MRNVYLDNNATTRPAPEAVEAMLPYFREYWGNPSSMHFFGGQVAPSVERARAQAAALFHAQPGEIVFTGCGTESNNMALRGAAEAMGPRTRIVTTRVEHPAVLAPCRRLKELGCELVELNVDAGGQLDLDELRHAVAAGPCLVSIMWANNETGVLFPIAEIAAIVKEAGGILHTDAVQAAGKVPIDLQEVPVDLLSFSGHKLHAPKGVGGLFIRPQTKVLPLLLGGHQENGRRAGTENVPYIVGLGTACAQAAQRLAQDEGRIAALRDRLENGLIERCPDTRVNGDRDRRLPNTSNISFQYIEGEAILYHLSDQGIAASSGSACTSGSLEPSHVIRAMGVPFTAAHGSIRFSLSRYTTDEDVDSVLEHMPPIVEKLRALSPFTP